MSKYWFSLVVVSILLPTLGWAVTPLTFVDQVKSLSLSNDGKNYEIIFEKHAAYYHVDSRSPAVQCLVKSMDKKTPVSITGNARKLIIDTCSFATKPY